MIDEKRKIPGVYVDLDELIALEQRGRRVSFLPKQPVHSLLSGRFASRMRGRGLNFEEIRRYLPGDDIRHRAWQSRVEGLALAGTGVEEPLQPLGPRQHPGV